MPENIPVTIAYGDGIGPDIINATLLVLKEAKALLHFDVVNIGSLQYEHGFISGIAPDAWKIIECNKIILKGPTSTPKDRRFQSASTTLRRKLDLFANVRHCRSYHPFIDSPKPETDIFIIKENEEGLYAGIERRQTANSYESLKLTTKSACEKICGYAFEFATAHGRSKVTCFTKDNVLRLTDGLFRDVFENTAIKYPDIKSDHMNIDIGAVKISSCPYDFDVIVTGNLYGDIISNIIAENAGGINLIGSANIGKEYAMFETLSGPSSDMEDEDLANPAGMINAAIMLLVHVGQDEVAAKIQNALLKTIEDGIHTTDIYDKKYSSRQVGTLDFAKEVVKRLGEKPITLSAASFNLSHLNGEEKTDEQLPANSINKQMVGVDIFFDLPSGNANDFAEIILSICQNTNLKLQLISSRGLQIWPDNSFKNPSGDYLRCRFLPQSEEKITTHNDIIVLLSHLEKFGLDFAKAENLYTYDGELGFSLLLGE